MRTLRRSGAWSTCSNARKCTAKGKKIPGHLRGHTRSSAIPATRVRWRGWAGSRTSAASTRPPSRAPQLPHMGWNSVQLRQTSPLFEGVDLERGFWLPAQLLRRHRPGQRDRDDTGAAASCPTAWRAAMCSTGSTGENHANGVAGVPELRDALTMLRSRIIPCLLLLGAAWSRRAPVQDPEEVRRRPAQRGEDLQRKVDRLMFVDISTPPPGDYDPRMPLLRSLAVEFACTAATAAASQRGTGLAHRRHRLRRCR